MHGAVRRTHTVDGGSFCGTTTERTHVVKGCPSSSQNRFEKAFGVVGDVLVEFRRGGSSQIVGACQNPVVGTVAVVVGNSFVPGLGGVGIDRIRREQTAVANTVFVQSRSVDVSNLYRHAQFGNNLLVEYFDTGQRIGDHFSRSLVLDGPACIAAYSIKNEVVLAFGNIEWINHFHIHRTITAQVLGIGHVAIGKYRRQNFILAGGVQTEDSTAVSNAFYTGNGWLESV